MKQLRSIFLVAMLLCCSLSAFSQEEGKEEGGVNLKEILFGHIQDSYQWHVTDIAGHPLIIPLPMIFYSQQSGFHIYCSSQFAHEPDANLLRQGPDGFFIKGAEDEKGQIVELVGSEYVPVCFDISITKTVLVLFINALLLVFCILTAARWCKKHKVDDPAPKGFVGLVHMFVMLVYNDMIKPSLGKEASKYAPYLLTCFFFIFLSNLMGVMPFPPGGGNLTGNITCTMFLALCTFLIVNITGTKAY
jgi:F-type H+-transporting ATPase subunit a